MILKSGLPWQVLGRTEDVVLQFAEFRSNPVYIKVCLVHPNRLLALSPGVRDVAQPPLQLRHPLHHSPLSQRRHLQPIGVGGERHYSQ